MKIHNQQDPAYNVNTVEKIFIEMVVMPGVMDLHDRDTVKVFFNRIFLFNHKIADQN